jgi:hypothetical protein
MNDKDLSKIIAIVYGVMYVVYAVCVRILNKQPKHHKKKRKKDKQ